MERRIIVIEDERDLADLVVMHLEREGFRTTSYANGAEGWAAVDRSPPDLVILDLMLPGMDGAEVCRRMRREERLAGTPLLVLTAKSEESDIVSLLELGADDYVTKPFSLRVLTARVRALLRRGEIDPEGEVLRAGPIEVDSGRHEVRVEGELVRLTHMEFRILRFLLKRPGRVRSRAEILDALDEVAVLERTIDVHVASLRRKLGTTGELIETVRGVGYRLKD